MKKDFEFPDMISKDDFEQVDAFVKKYNHLLLKKSIVFFGAGVRGGILAQVLEYNNITEYWYCDNNPEKWGNVVGGHLVLSPDELKEAIERHVVLISVESRELINEIEEQLENMGFIVGENVFSFPSVVYDNYINTYFNSQEQYTLIYGDCRFNYASIEDENYETIDDILIAVLKKENVNFKLLSMHALNMRALYYFTKTLINLNYVPKNVVLPINYEMYNGTMHMYSNTQHSELVRRVYERADIKDKEFEEYIKITKERTSNPPFIFSTNQDAGMEFISDKSLRLYIKMCYMYKLDKNNEGVKYFYRILELLKNANINILVYVPPLNYSCGTEFWGDNFVKMYDEGIQIFKEITEAYGGSFLNQSYLLQENDFYSKNDKNELPNYSGRVKIADSLMNYLKERNCINE